MTTIGKKHRRSGLTLLEVIVAMAIFLMSIIAIFQLVNMGQDRAMDVRAQARTSLRCQAKLAEMTVDSSQLVSSDSYTAFSDADKDLQWKATVEPFDETNRLYTVKVWVKADMPGGRTIESHLCQMVLNPTMRGTTFDDPKAPQVGQAPTGGN
jgi:Tfp pilus assembly protein PilV